MAEIQLKKFDMSEITHDKVVVLIGKRDTDTILQFGAAK